MNRRDALKAGVAGLALGLSRFPLGWVAAAAAPKRHILVYTRSQAFEHSVVKRGKNGEPSLAGLGYQRFAYDRVAELIAYGPEGPPEEPPGPEE